MDAKASLKSSVLSTGNQLLRLKKADTAALRSELSHIDSQWTELLTNIPAVQEKLHQVEKSGLAYFRLIDLSYVKWRTTLTSFCSHIYISFVPEIWFLSFFYFITYKTYELFTKPCSDCMSSKGFLNMCVCVCLTACVCT